MEAHNVVALKESFHWLQPRGVDLGKDDGGGEYIRVLRKPGEQA